MLLRAFASAAALCAFSSCFAQTAWIPAAGSQSAEQRQGSATPYLPSAPSGAETRPAQASPAAPAAPAAPPPAPPAPKTAPKPAAGAKKYGAMWDVYANGAAPEKICADAQSAPDPNDLLSLKNSMKCAYDPAYQAPQDAGPFLSQCFSAYSSKPALNAKGSFQKIYQAQASSNSLPSQIKISAKIWPGYQKYSDSNAQSLEITANYAGPCLR